MIRSGGCAPALVTGAAGGIGAAVATALAAEGRPVALLDRSAAGVGELAEKLAADGHETCALAADVTDPRAVWAAVATAEEVLGPLGVLVNGAGALVSGALLDLDLDEWSRAFAVNTDGVFHVSRAVGRRMRERREGSIVTITSNSAGVPRAGIGAYASAKAAATMFTRCLGLELAPAGVRCNIVCPGSTDTPMLRELLGDADLDAVVAGDPAAFKVGIPLGRVADPADVAEAVVFLASPKARHITMQALYVDGGATLRA